MVAKGTRHKRLSRDDGGLKRPTVAAGPRRIMTGPARTHPTTPLYDVCFDFGRQVSNYRCWRMSRRINKFSMFVRIGSRSLDERRLTAHRT